MEIKCSMDVATREDAARELADLAGYAATVDDTGEHPNVQWTAHIVDDDDVARFVAAAAWGLDRTPAACAAIASEVGAILARYPASDA